MHKLPILSVAGLLMLFLLLTACDLGSPTTPSQSPASASPASLTTTAITQPAQTAQPTATSPLAQARPTIAATSQTAQVGPTDTLQVPQAQPKATPAPVIESADGVTDMPTPGQVASITHSTPIPPVASTPTRVTSIAGPAISTATVHLPTPTVTPVSIRASRSPTSTPPGTHRGQIEVVASGFGSPDDLVVAPSGDIIFGDFGNKAVNIISRGAGQPHALASGLKEPEGLVVTKDGAIIVAEQATNRILEINYQTGHVKLLRQLVNNTGKDGVDGLGIDPSSGDILVADSPNGRLLRMSRDGTSLTTVATGFVRPTGAAVEPGGSIVVVDEFGNAVYRLQSNGSRTKLAAIYQPDDVIISPDGSIYVNSLGGDIVRIDPVTGQTRVLTSGLKLPHGLGIDSSGRLVIAEAGRNRIFRLTP